MNTKDNKRRQESRKKIEDAFLNLFWNKQPQEISVSDVCSLASINRSTFYAIFDDILCLARAVQLRIAEDLSAVSRQSKGAESYVWLLQKISENRDYYCLYFKLCSFAGITTQKQKPFKNTAAQYHVELVVHGIHAVIEKWLHNNCRETAEEMSAVICELVSGKSPYSLMDSEEGVAQ